ncbi:hypothetical protein DICPUDRAFT_147727 [Dictyostelium purpureum]|uniref:Uncharacterized protein n=1 Tax=Dictyostelium purpureum TaxID=5786 RepID=F0Z986_DICPU|nr:uncharacterized protein DICPUDRAFT_147727 [Dictyostelium purpureum]EGC39508.1 hypothetical protein DICPUDRAFT_147727 [Dictyostelium purpureum]|eukprot:XP_003283955.1 hypothetical protein DICPUDRAFT_147727 [Dictyostelium purpureum]
MIFLINIDEPLPYGITELEFTSDFKQPIRSGDIPPIVTNIEFCDWYTHQIDIKSVIPPSVKIPVSQVFRITLGIYTREFTTLAFCGFLCNNGQSEAALNKLALQKVFLKYF